MNIRKLNKAITEALDENGINKVVNAIEAELEHQNFQNMGVDVDEGAFEPSVTVFIHWFDEYTETQANLINEKFNVFKTTEHLNGAEVYTESDVNTLRDTDGETKSEGNVSFVALISEDTEIIDEVADEIAVALVQQLTNFWDEVYSDELVSEVNESVKNKRTNKKAIKEEKNAYVIYNKDECPIYNTIGCEECDLAADGSCLIGQDLRKLEKSVEHIKESVSSELKDICINDRYVIYPDGVVYDTEKAEDIPSWVFAIRDKIFG